MLEDIEVFFPVRIAVAGVVGADYLVLKDLHCSFIEAVCESVWFCLSFAGVAAPAGSVHPFGAVAGGVDVDTDEDDVGFAEDLAVGVGAADSFW